MSDSTSDFDFDFSDDSSEEDAEERAARRDRPGPDPDDTGPQDLGPVGRRALSAGKTEPRGRKNGGAAPVFDPTVPSKREQETNGGDLLEPGNSADPAPPPRREIDFESDDVDFDLPERTPPPAESERTARRDAREERNGEPDRSGPPSLGPGDGAFFADTGEEPFVDDAPVQDAEPELAAEPAGNRSPGRQVGGIALPDFSGVGARLRNLRLPERARPKTGGSLTGGGDGRGPILGGRVKLPFGWGDGGGRRKKGKIKKLRLLIIIVGLGLLGLVSTFFGMMMAVSSDLPNLENRTEYQASENSVVYDDTGRKLGTLTNNNNRILVESSEIAQSMKQAAVAIEDKRFYEHHGVDFQGMIRAAITDVLPGGSTQGASTITQQFVKNALEAQSSRTVFEKFREAALAYHLENKWDKDKILTEYLNTIYFGEGAYGIEAAAETYFGWNHPNCGQDGYPRCASLLLPEESAMLAGIIASPSAFSPTANPQAALDRRNLVLDDMAAQGYLTQTDADAAKLKPLPAPSEIQAPAEDSLSPYFTTWLRQILVDRYGAGEAFGGGLRIKTTLDYDLQQAAEGVVRNTLGGITPTSSIVVLDNKTGGIKAMVGGLDYAQHPFNLATNGHRQPGSAFKPFTLITALEHGHSPGETYTSAPQVLPVPNSGGKEYFKVANYGDEYFGSSSIETATIHSDNSVFAQLGENIFPAPNTKQRSTYIQKSLNAISQTAHNMGITTCFTCRANGYDRPNPAMILGGLVQGVTPLEMAHAYSTLADNGERVSGTLAADPGGPVPITEIKNKDGKTIAGGTNKTTHKRVIPESVASTAKGILGEVVSLGTGRRAQISGHSQWGKTGTTDNNGDAWFCGATQEVTACVWVGHADNTQAMSTEFGGQPVDGGTFPAEIWAQVVSDYYRIQAEHAAGSSSTSTSSGSTYVAPSTGSSSSSSGTTGGGGGGGNNAGNSAPAPAPSGGGGGGSGGVGAGL
jgi:penicillin-binding protein 1A